MSLDAILAAAPALGAWVLGSCAWSCLIALASGVAGPLRSESWPSYWLAWLFLAVAPPLLAPVFAAAPWAPAPIQVDAAVALADLTAPVQRAGAALGPTWEMLAATLAAIVLIGMGWRAAQLAMTISRAAALVRAARAPQGRMNDLPPTPGVGILVSEESGSIFCVGGAAPAIVLSRTALRTMSSAQLRMVVLHELEHLRRRDPALFLGLVLLECLFWFNPVICDLTSKVRLAAEIACDARALIAAPGDRRAYAEALVCVLAAPRAEQFAVLAAFGRANTPRIRLSYVLRGEACGHGARASAALIGVVVLLSLTSTALAASTARLATFGDAGLLSALEQRVVLLYGETPKATEPCFCDGASARKT